MLNARKRKQTKGQCVFPNTRPPPYSPQELLMGYTESGARPGYVYSSVLHTLNLTKSCACHASSSPNLVFTPLWLRPYHLWPRSLEFLPLRDNLCMPGKYFSTHISLFPSRSVWGQRDQAGLLCPFLITLWDHWQWRGTVLFSCHRGETESQRCLLTEPKCILSEITYSKHTR